jgi:hypothetical protein
MPPSVRAAWDRTRVHIDLGATVLTVPAIVETPTGGRAASLERGMSSRPGGGVLDAFGLLGECAWVVTAWNPMGRAWPETSNAARHATYAACVRAAGVRAYPAVGVACDGSWREEGLALVGIERPTAWRWAWELHQLGFFEVTRAGLRVHRAR